jgi:hypothetical protein
MPAFLISTICGALVTVAASVVGRVVLALGLGVFAYTGINALLDIFRSYFANAMGGAGAIVAGMCGILQLDVVMSIFIAAGLARLVISGATSGTIERLSLK